MNLGIYQNILKALRLKYIFQCPHNYFLSYGVWWLSSRWPFLSVSSWKLYVENNLNDVRQPPKYFFTADYDTIETVTCHSYYIYNPVNRQRSFFLEKCVSQISDFQERQRSLQHFIQIEDLPEHFSVVTLPSGSYASCGFQVRVQRKQMQFVVQVRPDIISFLRINVIVQGLPPELHVCHCQLGQLLGQTWGGSGKVKFCFAFRTLYTSPLPSTLAIAKDDFKWSWNCIGSAILFQISDNFYFRMAMLVTLFLVLINIFNSVR